MIIAKFTVIWVSMIFELKGWSKKCPKKENFILLLKRIEWELNEKNSFLYGFLPVHVNTKIYPWHSLTQFNYRFYAYPYVSYMWCIPHLVILFVISTLLIMPHIPLLLFTIQYFVSLSTLFLRFYNYPSRLTFEV